MLGLYPFFKARCDVALRQMPATVAPSHRRLRGQNGMRKREDDGGWAWLGGQELGAGREGGKEKRNVFRYKGF